MTELEKAAEHLTKRAQSSPVDWLKSVWDNMAPEHQTAVRNALIGAAVGGTALGGVGAMNRTDDESTLGAFSRNALMGALLGAAAGGGGTLAYDYTLGKYRTPKEQSMAGDHSAVAQTADALARGTVSNAGELAGGLGGAATGMYAAKKFDMSLGQFLAQHRPDRVRAALASANAFPNTQSATQAKDIGKAVTDAVTNNPSLLPRWAALRDLLKKHNAPVITGRKALAGLGLTAALAGGGWLLGLGGQRLITGEGVQ